MTARRFASAIASEEEAADEIRKQWKIFRRKSDASEEEKREQRTRYGFVPEGRWDMLQCLEATADGDGAADFVQAEYLYSRCTMSRMWEWIGVAQAQRWTPPSKKRKMKRPQ
jgi:hypothetical protein